MNSFGQRVIDYYLSLQFNGSLPDGITMMNPIVENKNIKSICTEFYTKFYHDNKERKLILGINPGRLGAGATGIPFTDTKRLMEKCKINVEDIITHEPSSVFIYDLIEAFGGVKKFYAQFYINSVCPLGFTVTGNNKKEVNYNYYDTKELQEAVLDFIKWNIKTQIEIGCSTKQCFCLGTGKNYKFLHALNEEEKYFEKIIPLEHPRFIMQYRLKRKEEYISRYLDEFARN